MGHSRCSNLSIHFYSSKEAAESMPDLQGVACDPRHMRSWVSESWAWGLDQPPLAGDHRIWPRLSTLETWSVGLRGQTLASENSQELMAVICIFRVPRMSSLGLSNNFYLHNSDSRISSYGVGGVTTLLVNFSGRVLVPVCVQFQKRTPSVWG